MQSRECARGGARDYLKAVLPVLRCSVPIAVVTTNCVSKAESDGARDLVQKHDERCPHRSGVDLQNRQANSNEPGSRAWSKASPSTDRVSLPGRGAPVERARLPLQGREDEVRVCLHSSLPRWVFIFVD